MVLQLFLVSEQVYDDYYFTKLDQSENLHESIVILSYDFALKFAEICCLPVEFISLI